VVAVVGGGGRPVEHPVRVPRHGGVGRAVAPAVALVVGAVSEAVVLLLPGTQRSFERQDGAVGLGHRPRGFPD
jgi:hypothetical protein